jgi:uncharacterized delta-60 repeat protein
MKRFLLSSIILLCLFSGSLSAQFATPRWTAVYQGTCDFSDKLNKIIPDGSGNFIGVGYTVRKGNYKDALIMKFDTLGDTLWWRTKNGKGNGDDEAMGAAVDASGNIYITGTVDGDNAGDNILVMKFDPNGTVQWDTTWDGIHSFDDQGVDVVVDGNGYCLVGGNTEPDTNAGSSDFAILKYSPIGNLEWDTTWSRFAVQHGKDELAAIALDGNNDVFAVGRSFSADDDYAVIKVSGMDGSLLAFQTYNGGPQDRGTCIVVDHNGDVIISGSSENGNGNLDFRTVKYSNSLGFGWTNAYPGPAQGDEKATAITVDLNNNIYITGSADILGGAGVDLDFQTLKYAPTGGAALWRKTSGSPFGQEDVANAIAVDPNTGDVYVTGKSDQDPSPTFANYDFMTVSYSTASGTVIWGPNYYNGTLNGKDDIPNSILLVNGDVYVAGAAVNTGTQKDATIVKYNAGAGTQVWAQNHNGTGDCNEQAKDMVVDASNNTYVAGSTFVENQNLNALIAKIDPLGNVVCTYQYNGAKNDDDEFVTMALSTNGSIYAAGYTRVSGQKRNAFLMKWNPATCDTSNIGWTRTYDYLNQSERFETMVLDNFGNIYVAGRSDSNPQDTTDNDDVLVIKYDSNGQRLWVYRWDGTNHKRDQAVKIILDNNGDIIVGGRTENVNDDFVILKLDPSGNLLSGFPVTYQGNWNDDRVTDITVDASNNIYVAGYLQTGSGVATQDPIVLGYTPAGAIIPAVNFIYSSIGEDQFTRIAFDPFGNLYVLNRVSVLNSSSVLKYDYTLYKLQLSPALNVLWSRSYDSPIEGNDDPIDMAITPNGDVYITGVSDDNIIQNAVNKNWVTIGYDSSGARIFIANADGLNQTDDKPSRILVFGSTIFVCGETEGLNDSQKDLTVITYDLPLGVSKISTEISSTVYPNPFNENTRISFDLGGNKAYIQVFDMLGNAVTDLKPVKGNEFNFSRGNLARGLYQYKITSSGTNLSTGKLIIN